MQIPPYNPSSPGLPQVWSIVELMPLKSSFGWQKEWDGSEESERSQESYPAKLAAAAQKVKWIVQSFSLAANLFEAPREKKSCRK